VEEEAAGVLTSILLLDGNRLRHGGAPNLPKAYTDAIDGVVIGPSAGSCGTAAYRGEQVIVEDIANDPLWTDYREAALPHSLGACWSTPVFSSQGKVIATFAMYYREPRRPSPRDQETIKQITDLAGVAIERKLTQEALLQSETYLTEAQRLNHTGSFGWNVTSREIFWSDETFRIFQLDQAKRPTLEFIVERTHPDDRAAVQKTIDDASSNGKDFDHEYRLLMPDGSVKHVHAVARSGRDASGGTKFVGAVTDITATKETEQKLRRSEDHLRLVTDTIPTLVWRAGPDGVPDFLNQTALDYTGLSTDQVEKGWPRAFHPDDKKGMLVKWGAIRASGMPGELEARLRRSDGQYRWFLFRAEPLRDEAGNIVKWYGSSTDIEDLKRAEVALRESEQRFRDYAETASDWLWETGPDHRVISISEHLHAVGLVPPHLARWDIATDVESEPEKWRLHRAMHEARQPFRDFEYRAVGVNGSPVYVRTSGKPFFDASGNFLGYRGTGTDITATIRADQAEEALRKAQAELAHVTRVTMLGELTASIAHEVNQPLAAIVANAEACLRWLDRATPDLAAAHRSMKWVIEDGNRAGEVIRRVRALAKKTDLEKVPLDLNDVAREVIALVQHELISHRISLRVALAPATLVILGDRVQLQQVIINLVINGIEAMQCIADRPRDLTIRSGRNETDRVFLSVTDCGVGICSENANQLFTAFFTTKSSGLGIGLSICRSIVETHGGRLSARPNEGPGATFQFILPSHQEVAS
jgi:PAS domain S-box-containing protein